MKSSFKRWGGPQCGDDKNGLKKTNKQQKNGSNPIYALNPSFK